MAGLTARERMQYRGKKSDSPVFEDAKEGESVIVWIETLQCYCFARIERIQGGSVWAVLPMNHMGAWTDTVVRFTKRSGAQGYDKAPFENIFCWAEPWTPQRAAKARWAMRLYRLKGLLLGNVDLEAVDPEHGENVDKAIEAIQAAAK